MPVFAPSKPQWAALVRVHARNVRGLVAPRRGLHRYAASAGRHLQRLGWLAWHRQRQGWVLTAAGLQALDDGDHAFQVEPHRQRTAALLTEIVEAAG